MCPIVLGNSSSLIRVVESIMVKNAPFLLKPAARKKGKEAQSVQGEAIRWSCGFIRNVTYAGDDNQGSENLGREGTLPDGTTEGICMLVAQTEIPRLVVQFVKDSPRKTVTWTKDSVEDICLGVMCNLAKWQPSREALKRVGAVEGLSEIEGLPGIHGYRARAIRCSLGALPKQFG